MIVLLPNGCRAMETNLFIQIIDRSPTLYLFALGLALRWAGSYINKRYPGVEYYQFATAIIVFGLIALRRLIVDPPYDGLECIAALVRAASFGMIGFGLAGGIGTLILMAAEWRAALRSMAARRSEQERRKRELAEKLEQLSVNQKSAEEIAAERRAAEEARRRVHEEQEAMEQAALLEAATRETARMQFRLRATESLPADKRKTVEAMIETYLGDDVPSHEFEQRSDLIHAHIVTSQIAPKPTGFQSLTEIEEVFSEKRAEIQSLEINVVEKEALASYLAKEKQAAIHKFLKNEASK